MEILFSFIILCSIVLIIIYKRFFSYNARSIKELSKITEFNDEFIIIMKNKESAYNLQKEINAFEVNYGNKKQYDDVKFMIDTYRKRRENI